jgi:hypothetical protein
MPIDQFAGDVVSAAKANGIDPAALLAVVEIESSGRPLERADNKTPTFLFERHVFFKQLRQRAPTKLNEAVAQNLAHDGWRPATQYQDQKTSAGKLALLARARSIDAECANRSCSWGLGQTMGFNAEGLGFPNATAMLSFIESGGVRAQIELMIRFIRNSKILEALNARDWERFARSYNGAQFKKNQYDIKLSKAYARWAANMPTPAPTPLPVPLQVPGPAPAVIIEQRPSPSTSDVAILRPLFEILLKRRGADLGQPTVSEVAVAPPPVLSPIDRVLGGQLLTGKKTGLAVVAYAGLSLLKIFGAVGAATPTGQVLTILIAAFGALGGVSKIDRGIQTLGQIAAKR